MNFKRTFQGVAAAALLVGVGLVAPASAELQVEEIYVNQAVPTAAGTNIRVNMQNNGATAERGMRTIRLFVRDNGEWRQIKEWNHYVSLEPGYRLSRDFFALAEGPNLDPALAVSQYDLRATVSDASGEVSALEHTHNLNVATDEDVDLDVDVDVDSDMDMDSDTMEIRNEIEVETDTDY